MISFFWKTGYYFNQYFYTYKLNFTLYNFYQYHYAVNYYFFKILIWRCDCGLINNTLPSNLLVLNKKGVWIYMKTLILINQSDRLKFMLNYLIVTSFPVLVDLRLIEAFNLLIYYLTRTYKGISLMINRPLFRRTRGRTYSSAKNKIRMMNPLLKRWWGLYK
jgi:hypothetical protein